MSENYDHGYLRLWYNRRVGVYYGRKYPSGLKKGWIAITKNNEKGFFDSKEEAEMALLKMVFDE